MICGSCLRDNALARKLREHECDVTLVPVYTPISVEEENLVHTYCNKSSSSHSETVVNDLKQNLIEKPYDSENEHCVRGLSTKKQKLTASQDRPVVISSPFDEDKSSSDTSFIKKWK